MRLVSTPINNEDFSLANFCLATIVLLRLEASNNDAGEQLDTFVTLCSEASHGNERKVRKHDKRLGDKVDGLVGAIYYFGRRVSRCC